MDTGILNDLALCIVMAWLLAMIAQMLRQPLLLAYFAAGLALGPVGFGWIANSASVETISELGLILLLFMIGLEIDLRKVVRSGRLILATSLAQVLGCALGGLLLFRALGYPLEAGHLDALYLAVACALSSTVIIVKLLYDKRELDTLPGRLTLGVLVLQDLFAILFLAFQPNLANPQAGLLFISLGKASILVAAAFVASRFALPILFRHVARLPELVLVGALAWCFLISGLASYLGLSREMGALVAGVALSTFPYTLDVAAKVTTLRDFFVTLFFVSLGMTVPLPSVALLGAAGIIVLFVIASRFLTVPPLLLGLRQGHRASLLPAINLAQLSEFSMVILALGLKEKQVRESTVGAVAYAFAILAVGSTYGILKSDPIWKGLSWTLKRMGLRDRGQGEGLESEEEQKPRIFLLGFSWTASSLLVEMEQRHPTLVSELRVIDFNPHVIDELKKRQVSVVYGDLSQRDTLLHAGISSAEIIICSLPNMVLKGTTNLRIVQEVRALNPTAQLIVHAELISDIPRLYEAGASYVSVPRLLEAVEICELIDEARHDLLQLKRSAMENELTQRNEIIP